MAGVGASFIGVVFFVAILSGLWIGIVGLRQAGRNGAWWTMFVGLAGISLTIIGYFLLALLSFGRSSIGSGPSMVLLGLASLSVPFSLLLFSIGFAMHGLKTTRIKARLEELEQLTEAMSCEIDRLREGEQNA